jgi:hypothetical protein
VQEHDALKHAEKDSDRLQLRKLELEVAELEAQQKTRHIREEQEAEKERREAEKLTEDITEKRLLNRSKERFDDIAYQKALLEIDEKKTAAKYAARAGVWDVLKYAVTLGSFLTAVGAGYIGYKNYRNDNVKFQHQVELERKFKVDAQVIDLLKNMANNSEPQVIMQAALALPAYGRPAIRLLLSNLRLERHKTLYTVFVESLVEIVAQQAEGTKRIEAANEVVQRLADQMKSVVDEFIKDTTSQSLIVAAHLDAMVQLRNSCSPAACDALKVALKGHAKQIMPLLDKLESAGGPVNKTLIASAKQTLA